jgi:TRAP-type C4-dicarboxylate transport system substrate-binding protein
MLTQQRFALIVMLVLVIGLFLISGYSIAAPEKPIILRFAGTMPATHMVTKSQFRMADLIAGRTEGRVKVEVFPSGQLYSTREVPAAVSSGAVAMGTFGTSAAATIVPFLDAGNLAFVIDSWDQFDRVMGSEAYEKMMADACIKAHWYLLCAFGYGELSGPITKKPVKTLEDLKGLKIRCGNRSAAEAFKLLGAAPADIDPGEVYSAIQRGTIDGALSGFSTYYPRKWYEVAKYITDAHFTFGDWPVVFNLETWNKLPKDLQKIIKECALQIQQETRKVTRDEDQNYIRELKKVGAEIYTLPPAERARWAKVARPSWDEWIKLVGKEQADKFFQLVEKTR